MVWQQKLTMKRNLFDAIFYFKYSYYKIITFVYFWCYTMLRSHCIFVNYPHAYNNQGSYLQLFNEVMSFSVCPVAAIFQQKKERNESRFG